MPHVDITMLPGRDTETKLEIARKVQQFLSAELGVERRIVSVSIEDVPREEWEHHMEVIRDEKNILIKEY